MSMRQAIGATPRPNVRASACFDFSECLTDTELCLQTFRLLMSGPGWASATASWFTFQKRSG